MKKSLLLILASLFAIFALAGCAEDSNNDTPAPTVTPIDLSNPLSLVGLYEITFFYTDGAKFAPLSSSCADVSKYVDSSIINGVTFPCDTTEMKGYGEVTMDAVSGTAKLVTKIQMTSSKMVSDPTWSATLKPQQYNYTEFSALSLNSITAAGINMDNAVKGTSGRNLTSLITPATTPEYPSAGNSANTDYSFTVDPTDAYVLINTMVDRSNYAAANVVVRMRKIEALPDGYTMDMNTAFPTPVIEGFVTEPTATPAN